MANLDEEENYFSDYFNSKHYGPNDEGIAKSSRSSSPILLLTPTPSYESLLFLVAGSSIGSFSNNIIIENNLLFLNHYKNFIQLFYDCMESDCIKRSFISKCEKHCHHQNYFYHSYYNHSISSSSSGVSSRRSSCSSHHMPKLYSIESLDIYLENLASNPRSLKSIARRLILNRLTVNQTDKHKNVLANRVAQLALPNRIKDYLLFIE